MITEQTQKQADEIKRQMKDYFFLINSSSEYDVIQFLVYRIAKLENEIAEIREITGYKK